jgi:3-oxoacyl-[acyl-carrier protein] reductase
MTVTTRLTDRVALASHPRSRRRAPGSCLAPETILAETNKRWIPADVQRSLADSHPLRQLGTPDDVARAALFLASDESSWITGVIVDIAGGAVLA